MGKKKSIAIAITGNIYTDQRIIRIANTLQENNFDVSVYYRPFLKYTNIHIENKTKTIAYPFEIVSVNSILNKGFLFYLLYNLILFCKLIFKKIDILYAVDSDTLLAMTLLTKIKSKPLIYDAHEYFTEVPELIGKAFKKRIWNWITQWGVNSSLIRLTVSETLTKELSKKYNKTFDSIINVPILTSPLNNKIRIKKPIILYQGALNAGRELHLLISAMKRLPNFTCLIVGEGDLSIELRNLVSEQEINNVSFLGLLSPNELSNMTNNAFIGFNLLESNSLSYYYSLSNKYFDYMHAGVPSLSSQLPEYELLNTELKCGLCIENTSDKIVESVNFLFNNKKEYQIMVENAIIASANHNWQKESQKLLTILNRI